MSLTLTPAVRMGLSIAVATGLYGVSFGALAVAAGLTVWQAMALSLLMFTGGSQFAFIGVIAGGGAGTAALGAAALLGLRNAVYGMQLGRILKPATDAMMIVNKSPPGVKPSGLGFDLPPGVGAPACGPATFGHNGSTGTLSWCDPASGTICVVLTTLYAASVRPHPMQLVSNLVAEAVA